MKEKRKPPSKRQPPKKQTKVAPVLKYELLALLTFFLLALATLKLGKVGMILHTVTMYTIGDAYRLLFIIVAGYAVYLGWKREWPNPFGRRSFGVYLLTAAILLSFHLVMFAEKRMPDISIVQSTWDALNADRERFLGGGLSGAVLYALCYYLIDDLGTKTLVALMLIASAFLISGMTLEHLATTIKEKWQARPKHEPKPKRAKAEEKATKKSERERPPQLELEPEPESELEVIAPLEVFSFEERQPSFEFEDVELEETSIEPIIPAQQEVLGPYQLPPMDLLAENKQRPVANDQQAVYDNARKLEKTFQSFGVKAKVTKVHIGPAVTKYEVFPDAGVKVSKIVNLSDDLALALAAKDIRIEAPIPGKSAIGIEVPNQEVAMVTLREVLESPGFAAENEPLLIALGRDITGDAVFAKLNKMPHLLVAGATGSGKSVCINGIITSILMRARPDEVKLMMIDPKMVELNVYNGIPHLLAPVVTDARKAAQALKKVVAEMERRYDLFSHTGTRNIEGYNEQLAAHEEKPQLLPYIVVIVDELADLMMVASNEVEDAIMRLAQMARAAGIHLIIATQRPSVDVITGVIKANIPSRIAFSVSSQTDSRTILDTGGAEKLLGRGDMLYMPIGANKPTRVQGAFLSDAEVEHIVNFAIAQQKAQYQLDFNQLEEETTVDVMDDELYDEAVQVVMQAKSASASMLQRRFRIGYSRAARLIDAMEARGVVGPHEGSKPRTVLKSFDA